MKIRTVVHDIPQEFDDQVNAALMLGYILGERSVLQTPTNVYHYAHLVLLDEADKLPEEPVEPQPVDPLEALRDVREFCDARTCAEDCQLHEFCNKHLPACEGPADWIFPGEEADK